MNKILTFTVWLLAIVSVPAQVTLQNAQLQNAKLGQAVSSGGGTFPSGADLDWQLNGDTTDSSGNGNTGTWTGTSGYANDEQARANHAAHFTFTQHIDTSSSTVCNYTTSDFTISVWFKNNAPNWSDNSVIVGKGLFNVSGYYLQYLQKVGDSSLGGIVFDINNGTGQNITGTATNLVIGTWYHIVFVKSGSVGKIYINGSDATVRADTLSNPVTDTHTFNVGEYSGGSNQIEGDVAEVTAWPRALSSTEISTIFTLGSR